MRGRPHRRWPAAWESLSCPAADQSHVERLAKVRGPTIDARLPLGGDTGGTAGGFQSTEIAGVIDKAMAESIIIENAVYISAPHAAVATDGAIGDRRGFAFAHNCRERLGGGGVAGFTHMNLIA